ncbi:MAG: alpha/beta hydrolase [Gemmatimonadaceae bacterium]
MAPLLVAAALGAAAASGWRSPATSSYRPRDAALRRLPLLFYPAADTTRPARAVVFFFGNDVGFWEAHQRLAERLAGDGYAVAGFDVRRFLASLPDGPAARESAYAAGIAPIIRGARRELGGDSLPLVIGGHSIGAEIALWTAVHVPEPGLRGVLAMSPGLRGHLRVTLSDLANRGDPREEGSFSVPDLVGALPRGVRVALVRGQHDAYRYADSALVAAGGARLERFPVALAGHSLKKLVLAGPAVERAMTYLVPPAPSGAPAGRASGSR